MLRPLVASTFGIAQISHFAASRWNWTKHSHFSENSACEAKHCDVDASLLMLQSELNPAENGNSPRYLDILLSPSKQQESFPTPAAKCNFRFIPNHTVWSSSVQKNNPNKCLQIQHSMQYCHRRH